MSISLYRVIAPRFVTGVVFEGDGGSNDICTTVVPILRRKFINMTLTDALIECMRENWKLEFVGKVDYEWNSK